MPSFDDIEGEGFDGVGVAPRPGKYTGRVTVRLTPRRSDAPIRYTTDGSEPGLRAPIYRQPLVLERTTKLRFRLFQDNKPIGRGGEAVFTITGKTPYGLPFREPCWISMYR